ncbi:MULTISPECIES: hypothetical protein [Bacteroidales]|jgi:hypothetical protein|uniref:hypothetical protein n=1 Tax=Bacteroidales TaxID=171549 RepID=UPI002582D490|nr:hypothetical protein [Xylanibacter rodentium]
MRYSFIGISVIALISALLLSSCSKEEYLPVQVSSKSCNIEIECVGSTGESLLADKSFTDKIKIEGKNSHTVIAHTIRNNRLCFKADLPDQNDMKWSKDKSEATGISKMTVKFGKQKASLKCFLKYIANRPPATAGGSISLEEVEYKGMTYKRSGDSVTFRIQFNRNGKL